jgi:MIP family channel proteins
MSKSWGRIIARELGSDGARRNIPGASFGKLCYKSAPMQGDLDTLVDDSVKTRMAAPPVGRSSPRISALVREAVAEFLGTFILMVFGLGVVAQVVLSGGSAGSILSIHIAWGVAVTMGIYVAGGISGAHLNPAVTLALAVRGRFPWRKFPAYVIAQFLGAFAASLVVFVVYHEALNAFDGGVRQVVGARATAGIWATYPQNFLTSFPGGFLDQFVGTALLLLLVFALTDEQNFAPPARLAPPLIGAGVVLIGACFGFNAGYPINPARDLAPRVFTALAGWGTAVFRAGHEWWWVPVVAPCLGGVAGALVYDLLLRRGNPQTSVAGDNQ